MYGSSSYSTMWVAQVLDVDNGGTCKYFCARVSILWGFDEDFEISYVHERGKQEKRSDQILKQTEKGNKGMKEPYKDP